MISFTICVTRNKCMGVGGNDDDFAVAYPVIELY